jgi:AcrR family transcriptional regulator
MSFTVSDCRTAGLLINDTLRIVYKNGSQGGSMDKDKAPARGRPRSEASREAIIAAASALLQTVGLNRMSIEAVAEASGVGKTTIYRWWPSKGTLALDAYLEAMRARVVVPDTGDSIEDFRRHARAVVAFYAGPEGLIFAQFMAEAQNDPALAEAFRERFLAQRRTAVKTIWARGVERGEFRADVDSDVAMDMIFAPVVYRLLAGHAPLSRSFAERLVDATMGGLAAKSPSPGLSKRSASMPQCP